MKRSTTMAYLGPAAASERNELRGQIISLVSTGAARSRSDLARITGLAPSTVSLHIAGLLEEGILTEQGEAESTGGRKPRKLEVAPDGGHVLVGDLGGTHARVGVIDLSGALNTVHELPLDVADGPADGLALVADAMEAIAAEWRRSSVLRGVCLSLPGPVDTVNGFVDTPSRMPGWHAYPVRDWLTDRFGVRSQVDNDANLMALGEHSASPTPQRHSVTVKTGTGIGSGVIVDNRVYRGANGAAGDITHARVAAAEDRPCSCGNFGCLETIASGAAIIRDAREAGKGVSSTADILALVRQADPITTTLVRTAGKHLGSVLSTVVNFFNPSAVYLGGALSSAEPFVAAVRSQLYEGCHPLVTHSLTIATLRTGNDAALLGAGRLILDEVLAAPSA